MRDYDLVAVCLWVQLVLPMGGRNANITLLQIQQMQRVASANPRSAIDAERKLRIKISIGAFRVVVVLAEVH
ncbi:hypothetical protein BKK79_32640 [Cupriavidus sp. USMAA2-4]|nr:hypothetical protein BKK79_32640 [Cupriavidus sp. USMAA2-4]